MIFCISTTNLSPGHESPVQPTNFQSFQGQCLMYPFILIASIPNDREGSEGRFPVTLRDPGFSDPSSVPCRGCWLFWPHFLIMNLHHSPRGSHIEKNRTKNTKLSVFDLRRYDCLDTLTKPFGKLKSLTKMVIKKTKS